METPSKFVALDSCDAYDRLIELPEPIIHHVISFLEANDIARLSFASKRYQQICISSPYLHFDVQFALNECNTKCTQFKAFLDELLRLHDGTKMHLFHLRWLCKSCKRNNQRPFDSWIEKALRCNVEELDISLHLCHDSCLELPLCESNSQSLRVLKLNLPDCSLGIVPIKFVSLEVLSLKSVLVDSGFLRGWISTYCPCLKRLNLVDVREIDNIRITSSSLEELTIHNCLIDTFPNPCEISIFGSSLKNVTISDCTIGSSYSLHIGCSALQHCTIQGCDFLQHGCGTVKCMFLENLTVQGCIFDGLSDFRVNCPLVEILEICRCNFDLGLHLTITGSLLGRFSISECCIYKPFNITLSVEELVSVWMNLRSFSWSGSTFKILPKNLVSLQDATVMLHDCPSKGISNCILGSVRFARVLVLNIAAIQVLWEKDHMPLLFGNLIHSGVLCRKLKAPHMIKITCFLMRAPNMKNLTIRCHRNCSGIGENDLKKEFLKLLPSTVDDYKRHHGNSRNLLSGEKLMKMEIELLGHDSEDDF